MVFNRDNSPLPFKYLNFTLLIQKQQPKITYYQSLLYSALLLRQFIIFLVSHINHIRKTDLCFQGPAFLIFYNHFTVTFIFFVKPLAFA